MTSRTGRRQFLQTVAAGAAAATTSCHQTEGDVATGTGGAPSTGGVPSTGSAAHSGGAPSSEGSGGAMASGGGSTAGGGSEQAAGGNSAASGGTATADADGSGGQGTQPRPTSPLGVALLGLGSYAGQRLAPALQLTEHCRLVGIITGTPSKVPEWQERYGIEDKNVYSYDNMASLIDNPDIHVVYVVTPNHVHPQFAIKAAQAKKHVWCEKPMAMTSPECQSIIDACASNGVKLAIGYRLHHEPNTQTIMSYASTKPFGAIERVDSLAGFSGFGPSQANVWRLNKAMGGGALYDMGTYAINAARYALGEEPVQIANARHFTERPDLFSEVDEWTEFEMRFPSGAVAFCRTSFGENIDRLEVFCENGSYKLEPMNAYSGIQGEASDGTQFNQTIENQQAKQMDDDALAILEDRPLLAPGEEGLHDVRVIEAIFEAARTGLPVDVV